MRANFVLKITGLLICLFGLSFLLPIGVAVFYADGLFMTFTSCFLLTTLSGGLLWFVNRRASSNVAAAQSFLIVGLLWFVPGFFGAIPFVMVLNQSPADAMFETVSGLTTTGATVISGLDYLPQSLLYYRQQLQWIGGMGIIVLAVAVMPMLNIGGMRLLKAEVPGPMKDDKMTPRVLHTARYLWLIYFLLTLLCAVAYWIAGMSWFDAIGHAMSTLSTGGFSTHDASIAYYDSVTIEIIAQIFMLAGGINFSLHFYAWHRRSPVVFWHDQELRVFIYVVTTVILICAAGLMATGYLRGSAQALRYSSFEVISVITSTGFGIADFSQWPGFIGVLLILISFMGGCAGSTAGGMKVVRVMFITREFWREIKCLLHPHGVFLIKHNRRPVADSTADAIRGFLFFYCMTTVVLTLAMSAIGLDYVTAFSAVAACINALGPGLGDVAMSFTSVPDSGKWLMVFAMVIGRLEIFTLLVLFQPVFWREL